MSQLLPHRLPEEIIHRAKPLIPDDVMHRAAAIVNRVRAEGEPALRRYAQELDGVEPQTPLFIQPQVLRQQLEALSAEDRRRLERVATRIRAFAQAQRSALAPISLPIAGGQAGHNLEPVERAGCYAPGGRHPLPSSVLMTVVTARVAGVQEIWVASPRPAAITLAAAGLAGADGLLAAGGAHAVAALAFGAGPLPPSDVVVGPGNVYVTAAKQIVAGEVAIDMLAGPSELVIVADATADPRRLAVDLLAQAEHDVEALPILLVNDPGLLAAVEEQLETQLRDLPTAATARAALANGGAVLCRSLEEACQVCNDVAPEHLQLSVRRPEQLLPRLTHYGAIFIGEDSAEVLGDYGAGPNHVLPTGGSARSFGGLSVFNFLRVRTWIRATEIESAEQLLRDVAWLARQEGLEAHARAAEARLKDI